MDNVGKTETRVLYKWFETRSYDENLHSPHGYNLPWGLPLRAADGAWKPGTYQAIKPRSELRMCENGLHCATVQSVYYWRPASKSRLFTVGIGTDYLEQAHAPYLQDEYGKLCARRMRLLREIDQPDARLTVALLGILSYALDWLETLPNQSTATLVAYRGYLTSIIAHTSDGSYNAFRLDYIAAPPRPAADVVGRLLYYVGDGLSGATGNLDALLRIMASEAMSATIYDYIDACLADVPLDQIPTAPHYTAPAAPAAP